MDTIIIKDFLVELGSVSLIKMSDGITVNCPYCSGRATHKESEFYKGLGVFLCNKCEKRFALERVIQK